MEMSSDSPNLDFHKYQECRDHYYKNMEEFFGRGEYRKASELLWGAITQAIKALASLSGIRIWQHREFKSYIRDVGREKRDEEYYELFEYLENLHRNFYDENIDPEDFPIYLRKAKKFLEKTQTLIDEKLRE